MNVYYSIKKWKWIFLQLMLNCIFVSSSIAQNLYNNLPFSVKGTATLYVSGSFTNESSAAYVNDATVTIKGDISNKETSMSQGSGITNITGTTAQNLSGTQAFAVYNAVVNNTSAGNSNFVFSNDLTVGNTITFTDGIVVTNANKMTLKSGATYSGASNSTHVNGFVHKIGNQAFIYPVGDGTTLRTASITSPSLATDAFTGKYIQANPNSASFNPVNKQAVLDVVSTCEYWTINRTTGASNVSVTLSWLNSAPYNCLGTVAPSDYYVARWDTDSTKWISHGNGSTTGTSASGTVITNVLPTRFGPFTLAVRNVPLPILLGYFEGKVTREGNLVSWKALLEKDTEKYTIEKSCNGKDWKAIGSVEAGSEGKKSGEYSLLDPEPCNGLTYYKLVEYSVHGVRAEYKVISLFNDKKYEADFQVFPNPNNGTFTVMISGEDKLKYEMEMTDILGKVVSKHVLVSGINVINCIGLASGVYLSQFRLGKDKITKKIVVN